MEDLILKKRVLEIAYKYSLSHLGSYFSSLDIIDKIYESMTEDDIFILSSGHAAIALYAVIEKFKGVDAEKLFHSHGGHPHLDEEKYIYCSTGSLGMGLTVAVGRALANSNRIVHCLISDGECAEGSIWEALRFIRDHKVYNLKVHVNINGYAAYEEIDKAYLANRLTVFLPRINIHYSDVEQFSFLHDLNAHYHVMSDKDYESAMEELNEKTVR